ncbi:mitochondrial carrier domain-containing protein [Haematococcus lacustris]
MLLLVEQQVLFWSPIELVKLRVQLQTVSSTSPHYLATGAMVRHIVRQEGVAGLFRGFTVTLLRDVPSFGVYFGSYHAYVSALEGPGVHPDQAAASTHMLAGGAAGCSAWCSIYGLDVVKSRMQATSRQHTPGLTWMHFGHQVWRECGLRGFTRGLQPTLIRAFFMDAASFLGYAYTLKLLNSQ